MDGVGLSLESKRVCYRFGNQGAAWQFDGEEEFHARLNGTQARLWNIMVASDLLETTIHVARCSRVVLLKASTCALLVLSGVVTLSKDKQQLVRVRRDEIVILDQYAAGELTLAAEDDEAHWALATIGNVRSKARRRPHEK
jgi:environmental stress-induced protein Ves